MEPNDRKHLIDEWLDCALKQRANVEPRPGLENRILASISAERNRTPKPRWNWRPVSLAVATAIVLVIALSLHRPASKITVAVRPAIPPSHKVSSNIAPVLPTGIRGKRTHAHRPPRPPHLDQFPSPQPLTEQEQILAEYVQRFPRTARLVAQAQTALLSQEINPPDELQHATQISDQQN